MPIRLPPPTRPQARSNTRAGATGRQPRFAGFRSALRWRAGQLPRGAQASSADGAALAFEHHLARGERDALAGQVHRDQRVAALERQHAGREVDEPEGPRRNHGAARSAGCRGSASSPGRCAARSRCARRIDRRQPGGPVVKPPSCEPSHCMGCRHMSRPEPVVRRLGTGAVGEADLVSLVHERACPAGSAGASPRRARARGRSGLAAGRSRGSRTPMQDRRRRGRAAPPPPRSRPAAAAPPRARAAARIRTLGRAG